MDVSQYMLMLFLRVNMYSEGVIDLMEMIMILPFTADKPAQLKTIQSKAKERYLPLFEKVPSCLLYTLYKLTFSRN